MTAEQSRVAVVGLGWAGRRIWLPRLVAHPAFRVTAVVDPDPVARATALRDLTGVTALSSVDDIVDADLVVVAAPNHLHCEVASRLLAAGVPVFVEKPVCLDSAEVDRLAEAELAGGAVLLAGSATRYRDDVRALYQVAGDLGRIRHVDIGWVRAHGVPDAGGWFTRRRLAGGGALVDLGWHLLDAVAPLLGPVTFEQVLGSVSGDFINDGSARAVWRVEDGLLGNGAGGDVEDTARGFLVTDNGISVTLRASWASHEAHDVTWIRVEGSAGTAELRCTFGFSPNREGGSTLCRTTRGETVPIRLADERIGAEYGRQLDDLPALLADPACRGRAVAEARRTIGVIERLYDSARVTRPALIDISS